MTNPEPFADKRGKSFNPQGATDWVAVIIATGGGAGFVPIAPGTWGSLVGLLVVYGLTAHYGHTVGSTLQIPMVWVSSFLAAIGIWSGNRAEKIFDRKDAGQVVIDEVCGQVISFIFIAPYLPDLYHERGWLKFGLCMLIGFLLFRAFDIFKPYPINRLQDLEGGLGVMMDDIIAGIYAAVLMLLVLFFVTG